MTEEKFKELLLQNNQMLLQEMDKRIDQKLDDRFADFDKKMDQKFEKADRRQNQKLAKLEQNYGEKISAIFDKIQLMDDIKKINDKENQKYIKIIEHHDDILYLQDHRISELEEKVSSM